MLEIMNDHSVLLGLSAWFFLSTFALGCWGVVAAASVWKPETAYDALLRVRKIFTRA